MLPYLWATPDGAQQLGAVAHRGGPVIQSGGELGCLAVVVFLVFRRLVFNPLKTEEEVPTLHLS